jgi:putative ABC transport system permease protein
VLSLLISQLRYFSNTGLGFNKDSIVLLPLPGQDLQKKKNLVDYIAQVPGVESTTFCYTPPAAHSNNNTGVNYDNRGEDEHWGVNVKSGDEKYISTFGLKLIAGRNLFRGDTVREFLVNETFVKRLNLKPNDVIGKTLKINGRSISAPIVGVVNDFYNYSYYSEIAPVCISTNSREYSTLAVKINMHTAKASLASFEKLWNTVFPDDLYSYRFVDDLLAEFYEQDATLLTLVEVFAAIAIVIGCLGLYGLVSFMAVRKTKEIGVRKVLGATLQSILWLFGKEFCRLLIVAFLIAAPIAWWAMTNYLKDYAYKIPIGPGIFMVSILSTFVVAAITVGHRATVAAITNPVKSLRSE